MYVVFIHGPAAAGKHTIGCLAAERLDVPLFHNHLTVDLAGSLFEFGTEPFRRLRAEVWQAAFHTCADADRSFIFTFHPEATVEPSLISTLTDIVREAGGTLLTVELLCSRATVLDRLSNESRSRFGKLTDPALYRAIEAQGGFEFQGLPEPDLRLNTDELDADTAASRLEAFVRRRLALA